jgi:uncharacterized protein YjlB
MTRSLTIIQPLTFTFKDDGAIPNSSLPLLVYRAAVPGDPDAIERIFGNNAWPPAWRNGVYPFHHFHANTHEVLGIARGEVEVLFGGAQGEVLKVQAGDVVVIPAGVGHCNKRQSPDLLVVGGYPAAAPSPDLHKGEPREYPEVVRSVAAVAVPPEDPVSGTGGPLVQIWSRSG